MGIKFLCPRWGSEQIGWDDFLNEVKEAGYDGVEWGIAADVHQKQIAEIFEKTLAKGLLLVPQHYDTYEPDVTLHKEKFAEWFKKMEPFKSLFINSQTGKDFFTLEQNCEMIEVASGHSVRTGVPVYHETHRGKFSFAAHIAKQYLEHLPSLQITLDVSHWVNVAESFLDDQASAMAIAIERTAHIHARVGHTEAPQIPDPEAPEWEHAVNVHLAWWDKIVMQKKEQKTLLTITPEFGPHPYLVHAPYIQKPIANQWECNLYMMNLLKERYCKAFHNAGSVVNSI